MHTVVQSASKTVTIGHDQPFVIIGERINPTGRKKFQELLRAGDLSTIAVDVESQLKGGADMLDVNMGVPLTDEPALLSKAIKMIQGMTDMPICIDSSVIEALQAGLEAYEGKALVNSMTGEDDRMELILPLIKKHNAAIIAIPKSDILKFHIKTGDTEGLVNYPLSIQGIEMAALLIDRDEERKWSFRSRETFDCNTFARRYFEGGGHFNASGGRSSLSVEENIKFFKKALVEFTSK